MFASKLPPPLRRGMINLANQTDCCKWLDVEGVFMVVRQTQQDWVFFFQLLAEGMETIHLVVQDNELFQRPHLSWCERKGLEHLWMKAMKRSRCCEFL